MSQDREIDAARAAEHMDGLTSIIARAANVILDHSPAGVAMRAKPDGSPVSAADEASEATILEGVAKLLPDVPIVSEESAPPALAPGATFIIVDPLDGTREYLSGSDEFTVNLAVVTRGAPIAGIIASPKRGLLWRGVVGRGAERLTFRAHRASDPAAIRTRRWPAQGAVAVASRSHMDETTDAFLTKLGPVARRVSGSAVKFCHLAEGAADVYPRLGPVSEWDVAAGDALVTAAGGIVVAPNGEPLRYGRTAERFRVPAFIAWGDPAKASAAVV